VIHDIALLITGALFGWWATMLALSALDAWMKHPATWCGSAGPEPEPQPEQADAARDALVQALKESQAKADFYYQMATEKEVQRD
jgi:hypothetical protein